ncbi:HlyD family secretion protein [Lewinella aquimaris]|uniref:HlyD family secretion protein n=1 Tax=Neolewinella aquimaris TaxID=1835722 RepID=A0A840E474_9BACT|nr:HlyD family efflux transporter periplasmic adaptor subunit [Neolewinella aquimaris]MBB4078465.1 HlyD family secretion protein [Neolewinella aquimaris]
MNSEAPRLFPFPLVEGNIEGLHARFSRTGSLIYLTVVIGILVTAAALPLIEVEVNSQSRGILRPALKLAPVVSPVSGNVTLARLRENAAICAGDTLLTISTAELGTEADHLRRQLTERREAITDLRRLTGTDEQEYPTLLTAGYQRDYRDFRRRSDEALLKLEHARRHLQRQEQLMETGSVARMDLEQAAYEVTLLEGQCRQLTTRQQHVWTQELIRVKRENADLHRQLEQLQERARQYVVTAPVDGHLTQTGGVQVGAFASAGQTLAQISPDGALRVEAYVSPSDIGLLRVGLPVRLQLDAFNYNQWGLARATLTEIGTDVTEVEGSAAFLVTCTLHDKALQLKNGYVGTLRKGMTLTAHFTLTRRSLFQLLHDKLDDWFNPTYN